MRKSNTPFTHKPSRFGHQDRYYAQTHRKRTFEIALSSTTRRSVGSSSRHGSSAPSQSGNYSGDSNPGCMIAVAVIILIVVVSLTIWSFSWEWASYSYPLNHKTDWSWLKIIFYPIMVIGAIFSILCIKNHYLKKNN